MQIESPRGRFDYHSRDQGNAVERKGTASMARQQNQPAPRQPPVGSAPAARARRRSPDALGAGLPTSPILRPLVSSWRLNWVPHRTARFRGIRACRVGRTARLAFCLSKTQLRGAPTDAVKRQRASNRRLARSRLILMRAALPLHLACAKAWWLWTPSTG